MRRILRFIIKTFCFLFLFLITVWLILLAALQTKPAQEWIVKSTTAYLKENQDAELKIGSFELQFPLNIRIHQLEFIKNQKKIVTIDDLHLICVYRSLLEGRLIFSHLYGDGITWYNIPDEKEGVAKLNKKSWEGPLFPFYVKIENLFLNHVILSKELIDEIDLPPPLAEIAAHSRFCLKGFFSNNPFRQAIATHLNLTMEDLSNPFHPVSLIIHSQKNQLSLTLEGNHLPSPAIKTLSLDSKYEMGATGPLNAWKEFIETDSILSDAIHGHFKFSIHPQAHPILTDLTVVQGQFNLLSQKEFKISEGEFKNDSLALKGEFHFANEWIRNGKFSGAVQNIEKLHPQLEGISGHFTFTGEIDGPLSAPSILFSSHSPSLIVNTHRLNNMTTHFTAKSMGDHIDGVIEAACDYQNELCRLTSPIFLSSDKILLQEIQFDALDSTLLGHVAYSLKDHIWNGDLHFLSENLRRWVDEYEGKAQLNLQLSPINGSDGRRLQTLTTNLLLQSFQCSQFKARQIKVLFDLDPVEGKENMFHITGSLLAQDMESNGVKVSQTSLKTTYFSDLLHQQMSDLTAFLNGNEITWADGKAKKISLSAELPHLSKNLSGFIKLSADEIQTSTLLIDTWETEGQILNTQTEWPFTISANGSWNQKWFFYSAGALSLHNDLISIRLNDFNGILGSFPFTLLRPLTFTHQKEETFLSDLQLQWGDSEILGAFMKKERIISSHLNATDFPAKLFNLFFPDFPLAGKINFSGTLEGPTTHPEGHFKLLLSQVQFTEPTFTKKTLIDGKVELELNDQGIELSSTLNGIGNTPVLINGTLPITLDLDRFSMPLHPDIPFALHINAEGELDPYLHLFDNDTANLTGQTKIALTLTGKMDDPLLSGTIDLHNGSYESIDTGAIYNHIDAHLEGSGSKILLTQFAAYDNKQGSITATGEILLERINGFPFKFNIDPHEIFILESDYVNLAVSGPLTLKGNRHKAILEGFLTSDSAILHLEQALPKQIKSVDIQYINVPEGEKHPSTIAKKNNDFIHLNVLLTLPNKVFLESTNLTSEWKGEVTLTGTLDEPLLNGDLRIVKGDYNLNGKIFSLTQGNIHFAGDMAKKTSLYVIAGKDIERIHAEIIVKGPVNKPVVSFRSNPPLSQREILSYILFNRGISDITPDQGDQLSQSFISLSESDQTPHQTDFLTRLRNNIGIDRLDITASEHDNKDLSLQVGKYISEGVFVSINKSINDVGNRVAIEANLRKNLKAEAEVEVGGDTQGKVSLKWKKDY